MNIRHICLFFKHVREALSGQLDKLLLFCFFFFSNCCFTAYCDYCDGQKREIILLLCHNNPCKKNISKILVSESIFYHYPTAWITIAWLAHHCFCSVGALIGHVELWLTRVIMLWFRWSSAGPNKKSTNYSVCWHTHEACTNTAHITQHGGLSCISLWPVDVLNGNEDFFFSDKCNGRQDVHFINGSEFFFFILLEFT